MKLQINWTVVKTEARLISKIAQRAVEMAKELGIDYSYRLADMDLTACHCNGNPLRLEELLNADRGNFGHDVFGIRANINRKTGELENGFAPRYSEQVTSNPALDALTHS